MNIVLNMCAKILEKSRFCRSFEETERSLVESSKLFKRLNVLQGVLNKSVIVVQAWKRFDASLIVLEIV